MSILARGFGNGLMCMHDTNCLKLLTIFSLKLLTIFSGTNGRGKTRTGTKKVYDFGGDFCPIKKLLVAVREPSPKLDVESPRSSFITNDHS